MTFPPLQKSFPQKTKKNKKVLLVSGFFINCKINSCIKMKKESVKEQILQKMEEKLISQSFNDIRIDTIAQELRISKRTIYELFESKDKIFKNVIQRHYKYCVKIFEQIIADMKNEKISFYTGIEELMKLEIKNKAFTLSDVAYKFPEFCTKMKQKHIEFCDALLDIAIEHKVVKANLNKKLFYLIAQSLATTILDLKVINEYELDFPKLTEIKEIIIYGILTDEARQEKKICFEV